MDFGALSVKIRVIPSGSDSVAEVNIHRFAVIGVGMVTLHEFLISRASMFNSCLILGIDSCNV